MKQSIRLGSIAGIPVGLNWGMLLIAAFYVLNLAFGILPAAVPDASTAAVVVSSIIAVGLFFGSILAHELGHSIVAQRNGIGVRAITLWLLGGVAELESEADSPGAEFRIAIAGPAVSAALAALFGGIWFVASPLIGGTVLSFVLGYLAVINVALAVFNMIPAAPLDGGRVLASAIWWMRGNRHTARAQAAIAGQVIGNLILAVGILLLFRGQGTIFTILIGWFIRNGATQERRRAEALNRVSSSSIESVMQRFAQPISPGITLTGLAAMSSAHPGPVAFPLLSSYGVSGVVPSTALADTRPDQRHLVMVEDVVVSWDECVAARTDEALPAVIERAGQEGKSHVVVYDNENRPVGYIALNRLFAVA